MPIINEDQQGSINFSTPNSYVIVEETPASVRTASTNVVGLVCSATRGATDKIHEVGSIEEWEQKLGRFDTTKDGYMFADDFFKTNGGLLEVVRVALSGATTASVFLPQGVSTRGVLTGNVATLAFESIGTDGNQTYVDIAKRPLYGHFDLKVRNGRATNFYETISLLSTAERYILTVVNQDENRMFNVTANDISGAIPYAGTYQMTGGTDGGTLTADDYIGLDGVNGRTGIQLFKESDTVLVVASAKVNDDINTALIAHVNDTTLSPRRTVITFPVGTSIDSAVSKANLLNSDKVKIVYPHVKRRNINTRTLEVTSAVPFSTALDSVLPYNVSASNRTVSPIVVGIERKLSPSEVNKLTRNQINPIVTKKGVGIMYASDYTTSKNPELSENTTMKAKQYIGISLDGVLQFYASKNIDDDLFSNVSTAFGNFLQQEQDNKRIGKLGGGKAWSVDISTDNNPTYSVRQNRVNAKVKVSLKGNANTFLISLSARIENEV